jgi:small subunit ribosomal protein S20
MPVIKSAKKALKQSHKKKTLNDQIRRNIREAVRVLRKTPSRETLQSVYSTLDRAAKQHLMHKNRVARLKSNYSKLVKAKAPSATKKSASKTK